MVKTKYGKIWLVKNDLLSNGGNHVIVDKLRF